MTRRPARTPPRSDLHVTAESQPEPSDPADPPYHPTVRGIFRAFEADMRLYAEMTHSPTRRRHLLRAAEVAAAYAERFETPRTDPLSEPVHSQSA